MNKIVFSILFLFPFSIGLSDNFDDIKADLKSSECCYFEFYAVVESDIFDTVDSAYGTAYLALDGRYAIALGDEEYLSDLKNFYTYVRSNNQLIIEKTDGESNDDILFITKLDEFYKSYILRPDLEYRLIKKDSIEGDFPDSLVVLLEAEKKELKQILYFDVNEELNRIIFLKQKFIKSCDDSSFEPNYPDSVEKIKL